MTPTEFAQKIRAKYPGAYDDLDDNTLTQKVIQKYPIYKDQVNFESQTIAQPEKMKFDIPAPAETEVTEEEPGFLEKAGKTALDVGIGAGKGAAETLSNIGGGIMEAVTLGKAETESGKEFFEPKSKAQAFGKGAERIAEFILPSGRVTQATKALPFLSRLAVRTLSDMGILTAQEGEFEPVEQGVISVASQVVPGGLKLGSKWLGNIFKRGAGILSGKGTEVIEEVLKSPEAAEAGLKGDSVSLLRTASKHLVDYIKTTAKEARDLYGNTLEEIEKNYDTVISGFKSVEGKVGSKVMQLIHPSKGTTIIKDPEGNRFNLSLNSLKSAITTGLKEFKVEGSTNKGFDFTNSSLTSQEENLINRALERFQSWTDITPTGLNRLRQIIGGFARPESVSLKRANAILLKWSGAINDYLAERVPGISDMNAQFKNTQQFLEQLQSILGQVEGKPSSPKLVDDVSRKIALLFNANKQIARDVITGIPGGIEILGKEAGRQLKEGISRASASIGDKFIGLIQTVVPPESIAKFTVWSAKQGKRLEPLVKLLEKLEPAARGMIIRTLNDSINDQ